MAAKIGFVSMMTIGAVAAAVPLNSLTDANTSSPPDKGGWNNATLTTVSAIEAAAGLAALVIGSRVTKGGAKESTLGNLAYIGAFPLMGAGIGSLATGATGLASAFGTFAASR